MHKWLPILIVPAIAGCSTIKKVDTVEVSEVITADLARADGSWAGVVTISKRSDGTFLSLSGEAPNEGIFGMHIHAVGKCVGPGFETAGPHWNPEMKQHGFENPLGAHGGDLPNVVATADRKLTLEHKLPDLMLEGPGGIIDADGAALVIHAKPDDYKTDPSGDSGKRIICGVLKSGHRAR